MNPYQGAILDAVALKPGFAELLVAESPKSALKVTEHTMSLK
jgi:hypothetical protein